MTTSDTTFDTPRIASLDDMCTLMRCAESIDFRKLKTQLVDVAMFCGDKELVRHGARFWRRSLQNKPTIRKIYPLGVVTECDNELGVLVHEFGLRAACIVEMHEPLTSAEYANFPFVSEVPRVQITQGIMKEIFDKMTLVTPSVSVAQLA